MRIGYYTPHVVNWNSGAGSCRMPMLEGLVERGHEFVLLRPKHQKPKPEFEPAIPVALQCNLEKEAAKLWEQPPDGYAPDISKTDAWMSYNLDTHGGELGWPEVDVIFMEPFHVFPPNILFQMQLLMHYAPETPVVMYDLDLGHGAGLMSRMKKLFPAHFEHRAKAITAITMTNHPSLYEGLGIRHVFEPFAAWDDWQMRMPNPHPDVDIIFAGRDLFRRPRMRELVLGPSEHGCSVRVHGDRYDDAFKAEWPNVQWHDPVPPSALIDTLNSALVAPVVLQARQVKLGFYPLRFVECAISGPKMVADANVCGIEAFPFTKVAACEDVVAEVERQRERSMEERRSVWLDQLDFFQPFYKPQYVDRIEAVLQEAR